MRMRLASIDAGKQGLEFQQQPVSPNCPLMKTLAANPGWTGGDPWRFGGFDDFETGWRQYFYLRLCSLPWRAGDRVRAVTSCRSVRNNAKPRVRPVAKSRMAERTIMGGLTN